MVPADPARGDSVPTASGQAVEQVSYTTGQQGGRLKWLPHRPQEAAAEVGTATRALHDAPAGETAGARHATARLAQSDLPDPFRDPFQERAPGLRSPGAFPRDPADPSRLLPPEPDEANGTPARPMPTPLPLPRDLAPQEPIEPYTAPELGAPGPLPSDDTEDFDDGAMARNGESGWSVRGGDLKFDCPSPNDKEYYRPIRDVSTDLTPPKAEELPLPPECGLVDESFDPNVPRPWASTTFTWKASGLCHKPLYFEQVHAERYGHCRGPVLQTVISHAHFFLTVPVLPYKTGLTPPKECMYTLGYYRPGSCAPYMLDPLPLSVRAGLFQAGAWVGGAVILP